MNKHVEDLILKATDAQSLCDIGKIQDLWGGYGAIRRYRLTGSHWKPVVVKHVHWPQGSAHPRARHGDRSHQRKIITTLLDYYFSVLKEAVKTKSPIPMSPTSNLTGVPCIPLPGPTFTVS